MNGLILDRQNVEQTLSVREMPVASAIVNGAIVKCLYVLCHEIIHCSHITN